MANYAVTDFVAEAGTVNAVTALLETQLETIDNGKTVRLVKVIRTPNNKYIGVLIYDA